MCIRDRLISGYQYCIDTQSLGLNSYRILIATSTDNVNLRNTLQKFCIKNTFVHKFIPCLGEWDFELEADAKCNQDIINLRSEIYKEFGEFIAEVKVLPLLKNIPLSLRF